MVNRALIGCLCLLFVPFQLVAALTASVDRNPVLTGEFFNLTIRADKTIKGEQPDTAALLKHFVVGPTSTRSSTNMINGQVSRSTQWQIELMARKPGTYTINSFNIGGMTSTPITIRVAASADDNNSADKVAFIKTSMTSTSLFVQQAGVYKVQLFLSQDIADGQLETPKLDDANVTPLGKQKENYEIIEGVRHLVIEREYLIQPQKSGEYTIKSPYFKGRIRDRNYRSRSISAMGEDINLTIKPIPEKVTGNWLPSELVTLNEEWQPEEQQYQVGDPITRTITLTALGITKEQLPEITIPNVSGIRSYSDQSQINNTVRNGRVISQKVESFALLPQMPGQYTMPEVRIPWFNIVTNRIEYASLPERKITIISDPNAVPAKPTELPIQSPIETTPAPHLSLTEYSKLDKSYWIIALSGYILWLVTTIIAWRLYRSRKSNGQQPVRTESGTNIDNSSPLGALHLALKQNNQRAFYHALIKLCKYHTNSSDLTKLIDLIGDKTAGEQISMLQANLYAGTSHTIDLALIYKHIKTLKTKTNKNNALASIY
jgi:hypothetical protein